jgi:hypothetical protein
MWTASSQELDKAKVLKVGSFKINCGSLVVADPCYTVGAIERVDDYTLKASTESTMNRKDPVYCLGILENVKNGTWNACVSVADLDDWGERVSYLTIKHDSIDEENFHEAVVMSDAAEFRVFVDAGMAGFYDRDWFETSDNSERADSFFNLCKHSSEAGCLNYGVASSSGLGDGDYDCYTFRNEAGELVFSEIKFLHPED